MGIVDDLFLITRNPQSMQTMLLDTDGTLISFGGGGLASEYMSHGVQEA